ncbi:MAG TPA: hypothetical protein VGZ52_09725, partial [Acidimicrobiales bacterium]|nr:hypothetical protein [Acidimicrobiales bacterium]
MQARLNTIARRLRRGMRKGHSGDRGQVIELEYPVVARPRWGYDRPPHPELSQLFEAGRARYAEHLRSFLPLVDELAAIPLDATGTEPR